MRSRSELVIRNKSHQWIEHRFAAVVRQTVTAADSLSRDSITQPSAHDVNEAR